ncbi:MAG TPA: phosphoribosylaminoimidazolesuccinocarboxamide synthase [Haliangiales bacterium]|nr:phosphoribosylaminoimidazolesuccinocarboxamide synthase [Haliangiales bacterium]
MSDVLRDGLARTLDATHFDGLGVRYEGKVRDNYTTPDGRRILVATDRLSTFDVVVGTIPYKGQVLNQLAAHWFEETAAIAPNHVIAVPDPNVTIAHECEPLKAEFIMRAYLTGVTTTSIWYAYERGARRFCGHALADGMKKNQKLARPILTPSTKADKGDHDVSVSREELLAMGAVSAEDFDAGAAIAETLFAFGQKRARERGLILVDTKYELGRRRDGRIVVIDEIHTPDSSRYWYADDYEERLARREEPRGLDKEYVRRWLVTERNYRGEGPPPPLPDEVRVEAARRYIATCELVTGRTFVPDTTEPLTRIRKALGI